MNNISCSELCWHIRSARSGQKGRTEKKKGEGSEERDKLQWSKALKEEVDRKQGESPALPDNLQGARTALLELLLFTRKTTVW